MEVRVTKRYCSIFRFTKEFITKAILECLSHKTGKCVRWYRKDTSYFLAEYYIRGGFTDLQDLNEVARMVRTEVRDKNLMQWYKEDLVPYIAECLLEEIETRSITLRPIIYQERLDSSSLKVRAIGLTSIKQQVYDYIVVMACEEMFLAKIGQYQCASIKGRGQLYAKKHIETWIRKKHKKVRHATKFDVRQCYPSISHDILFKMLERDIKNEDILYVIKVLVGTYSSSGYGLCIGTYLSQFLANYYLSYAYHYVMEQAYKERKSRRDGTVKRVRLIHKSVFYMDDILLLGSCKKDTKKATHMMIAYMRDNLGLSIKHNQYQYIDLFRDGAFIDMVGYRFYKDKTIIRERIYERIKSDTKAIRKGGYDTDLATIKSFMSRHGYVKNTDSAKFRRKQKYDQCFRTAKRRLQDEAKMQISRETA